MTGIRTRGGTPVRRVLCLSTPAAAGYALVEIGPPSGRYVQDNVYAVRLADLTGPAPDWAATVRGLMRCVRESRTAAQARCPVARLIARAAGRMAVAELRRLTHRPRKGGAR